MPNQTDSYIIISRTTATRIARLVSWVAILLTTAGPSWHRHVEDMRLACAELEDAIARSERASDRAAAKAVA